MASIVSERLGPRRSLLLGDMYDVLRQGPSARIQSIYSGLWALSLAS